MLIALDIDGTIVDWDENLSPRVEKAIRAARAAGHVVVLATGRSLIGTTPVASRLGIETGWLVTSNGAVIGRIDPDAELGAEITDVATFDPAEVLRQLRVHLPQALFFVECRDVATRLASGEFPDGELTGHIQTVPFEDLLHVEATRVVVRSPDHTAEEFSEIVASTGMHGGSYSIGWTAWLDIAPQGISKASALETIRQRLGIPIEQTIAVGDGTNDLEMFAWAHRSVAMGQALEAVKQAAAEVTASVTDDGLALVLEDLLD